MARRKKKRPTQKQEFLRDLLASLVGLLCIAAVIYYIPSDIGFKAAPDKDSVIVTVNKIQITDDDIRIQNKDELIVFEGRWNNLKLYHDMRPGDIVTYSPMKRHLHFGKEIKGVQFAKIERLEKE